MVQKSQKYVVDNMNGKGAVVAERFSELIS
jgi:hypothetical protein